MSHTIPDSELQILHQIVVGKNLFRRDLEDLELLVMGNAVEVEQPKDPVLSNAAAYLEIEYEDAESLASSGSNNSSEMRITRQNEEFHNFVMGKEELKQITLLEGVYTSYQYSGDKGVHYRVEARSDQKARVTELLKEFKTEFPILVFEMEGNISSIESRFSKDCDGISDPAHKDFDWEAAEIDYMQELDEQEELKQKMRENKKNVLFSDDPASQKLKSFAQQNNDLTDMAWSLGYNTIYMQHDNCPHYHIEARPGKREHVAFIVKEFNSDIPIIITEMSMRDYMHKISPKNA